MMDTLGTKRTASIIFDNNSFSRPFNLGTGRPQGDVKSPVEFNVGEQILIFKIELDVNIKSVYSTANIPRSRFQDLAEEEHVFFRDESNAETDKVDAFADDASTVEILE
jgi:hypothetical protein